eukprot:11870192-Karenia_brevis.AAC.1
MINSLHTNAWFKVGDLPSVVVTSTGGRQGCRLGGIIFNGVYERALAQVRHKLREAGITLKLSFDPQPPFW